MSLDVEVLDRSQRVHFVGIGGIGVSAVARALHALGHTISGSDRRASSITGALEREGIVVGLGSDPARIGGVDLVGRSGAVPDDDPEIVAARAAGTPVLHRAALLGAITGLRRPAIGVLGTHGKGTVAAMLTRILEEAGADPSFVIGAQLLDFGGTNARMTASGPLVAEVDESDGSHALVPMDIAVLNNLEADHLNYYPDLDAIRAGMYETFEQSSRLRAVCFNAACTSTSAAVPPRLRAIGFALNAWGVEARLHGRSISKTAEPDALELRLDDCIVTTVRLAVPGRHNHANAVAAAAAALELGCSGSSITRGLESYQGLLNRMTMVEFGPTRIVKDFISHATGIRAVLETLAADARPIIAVFRPFRYTLVRYLREEYVRAFAPARRIVITEMDEGDEAASPGGSAEDLAARLLAAGAEVDRVELAALPRYLARWLGHPVQVVAFGGDDLFAQVECAENAAP